MMKNYNADILTAFYSPIEMDIEIILAQNIIELPPTNEYCQFFQTIQAGIRTMPICGPIILCANSFTAIYIESDQHSLKNIECYGVSFDDIKAVRILKRHEIHAHKAHSANLEYKSGFVTAYPKGLKTVQIENFIIVPDPFYDESVKWDCSNDNYYLNNRVAHHHV